MLVFGYVSGGVIGVLGVFADIWESVGLASVFTWRSSVCMIYSLSVSRLVTPTSRSGTSSGSAFQRVRFGYRLNLSAKLLSSEGSDAERDRLRIALFALIDAVFGEHGGGRWLLGLHA